MTMTRTQARKGAETLAQLVKTIAARVREERKRKHLTQERLAELTNLSTNYIAHIERGTRGVSMGTLVQLVQIFGVPAYSLLLPSASAGHPRAKRA